MLEQVNDSLKDAGVEVTLTSGNYEQQLNAMIANPHAYTASLRQNLQDAKKSLEDLQEFRDGVKSSRTELMQLLPAAEHWWAV